MGAGTNFDYDINTSALVGGSSNDLIAMTGGTLSIGGTGIVFNFDQLSTLTTGVAYTLIDGASSIAGFTASDFSATGISGYAATFSISGDSLLVTFNAAAAPNYYFTGSTSDTFTDATNYYTQASGGTQQSGSLSSTSNVYLDATSPTPANTPPTLNGSASINSLTFLTANETLAGSGTVTLAATGTAGITDSAGVSGDTETVAPSVALGSDQTWTATANSTLNVTGNVSGPQSLAVTGAGTVKLAGANTFQGLTVGTGSDAPTVLFTNTSGSASGTTTLTVNSGATIGGTGTSSGTSFNIAGTGTATGQRANVLVGMTSASDANTTQSLTMLASSTATITNANLTFNINSQVAGQGTELNVGGTLVTFGAGVQSTTLTLNVENAGVINGSPLYVLIAGNTSGAVDQYSGLTLGTGVGDIATGLLTPILDSGAGGTGDLTLALTGMANTWYGAHSELFLYQNAGTGADDIEVEVVPEPGTWALMLGGLAMLVFWQRTRRQNKA